jgi:hypothetical protein
MWQGSLLRLERHRYRSRCRRHRPARERHRALSTPAGSVNTGNTAAPESTLDIPTSFKTSFKADRREPDVSPLR